MIMKTIQSIALLSAIVAAPAALADVTIKIPSSADALVDVVAVNEAKPDLEGGFFSSSKTITVPDGVNQIVFQYQLAFSQGNDREFVDSDVIIATFDAADTTLTFEMPKFRNVSEAKKGFNKKGKQVDESIYSLLNVTPRGSLSDDQIAKRCTYMMLNEAARCIDEGIVRNARDADIGAIFGIGFPPFLGGPLRYIDKIGAQALIAQLRVWADQYGERYAPCEALITMAENGAKYYQA